MRSLIIFSLDRRSPNPQAPVSADIHLESIGQQDISVRWCLFLTLRRTKTHSRTRHIRLKRARCNQFVNIYGLRSEYEPTFCELASECFCFKTRRESLSANAFDAIYFTLETKEQGLQSAAHAINLFAGAYSQKSNSPSGISICTSAGAPYSAFARFLLLMASGSKS